MKVSLKDVNFKSLKGSIDWQPDCKFAILTGVNGSGKTQFLNLLQEATKGSIPSVTILGLGELKERTVLINSEWEVPQASVEFLRSPQTLVMPPPGPSPFASGPIFVRYPSPEALSKHRKRVSVKLSKDEAELTTEELFAEITPDILWSHKPAFSTIVNDFASMSVEYYLQKMDLMMASIESNASITNKEIIQKLGTPPWECINNILAEIEFPYRLDAPSRHQLRLNYTLRFTGDASEIPLSDLSSGEKIIMGMTFWLYALRHHSTTPILFLMDEADAHLHPSLIPVFLRLINKEILERAGSQVILATHRPDTIALGPEQGIFAISRNPLAINRISKDQAILTLSDSILTVSRRACGVLVESDDDERFYQEVLRIMNQIDLMKSQVILEFRRVELANSGATQGGGASGVQEKVAAIRKIVAAFKQVLWQPRILGLIDRDADNKSSDGVHVLKRYSYENYLYEPLVIYCHLLKKDAAPSVPGINIHDGEEFKVKLLTAKEKQMIIDVVVQEIENGWAKANDVLALTDGEKKRQKLKYCDNSVLELPLWYTERRGKDIGKVLETLFKGKVHPKALLETFSRLKVFSNDLVEVFHALAMDNEQPRPR